MLKFFKRSEKTRRINACLNKLSGWSIDDLENPNMQIGKLELIPPDDIQIINLTWMEIPIGVPLPLGAVFNASVEELGEVNV
ncbi:hypothetical protein LCGC14_0378910 [marine sediment metagenome]|uniref:Uncharacterized protein n=1 Tax=marine sediment metagenome TaxID=412755 RepID=A0A0F9WBT2_9ZZZZ